MMFADAEEVQADLIGEGDFFEEVVEAFGGGQGEACSRVGNGRRKTVYADLHRAGSMVW